MGISYQVARTIVQEHKNRPIGGSVLMVGRQTVSMTPSQAMALIESEGVPLRPNVPIEIDRWTVGSQNQQYISDRCFFSLFADAETVAIDVSDYEKAEYIHDLNGTLPSELFGRFDFMFNGSCLDNLFDAASALKNMSRLLSGHGRILHIEHHSAIQTAYVMYSPAYFFDYYAINGFADIRVMPCMFDEISDPWYVFDWRAFRREGERWTWSPHTLPQWRNTLTLVLAEKGPESTSDRTPIQAFYRGLHATEKNEYFEMFERARSSPRKFRFGDLEPTIAIDSDAFEFIGILASPEARALSALNKARQALSQGDLNAAREGFTTAITVAPHIGYPGLVFAERGDVCQALGDDTAALADYEQAVALNPQEASYRQRIEVLASKAPRKPPSKAASTTTDKWLTRMGTRTRQRLRGLFLRASPEERAMTALIEARKAVSEGHLEQALSGFSEAIKLAPHIGYPGLVYVERGDVHQRLGRDADAMADYRRALKLKPDEVTYRERIDVLASKGLSPSLSSETSA